MRLIDFGLASLKTDEDVPLFGERWKVRPCSNMDLYTVIYHIHCQQCINQATKLEGLEGRALLWALRLLWLWAPWSFGGSMRIAKVHDLR